MRNFWVNWFPIDTIWTFVEHQSNVSKCCEIIMISNVASSISSSVFYSILPSDFSKLSPRLFFGPLSCFTLISHSPHGVWLELNWVGSSLKEHEVEGAVKLKEPWLSCVSSEIFIKFFFPCYSLVWRWHKEHSGFARSEMIRSWSPSYKKSTIKSLNGEAVVWIFNWILELFW